MTAPLAPTAVPAKAEDVLATDSQDLTVLMSMDTGKFVELNATAREVWNLTDGRTSIAQVVERLGARFDVAPEECAADVVELYTRLREEGLVAFAD